MLYNTSVKNTGFQFHLALSCVVVFLSWSSLIHAQREIFVSPIEANTSQWTADVCTPNFLSNTAIVRLENISNIDQTVTVSIKNERINMESGSTCGVKVNQLIARTPSSNNKQVTLSKKGTSGSFIDVYFHSTCAYVAGAFQCAYSNNEGFPSDLCSGCSSWTCEKGHVRYSAGLGVRIQEQRGAVVGSFRLNTSVTCWQDQKYTVGNVELAGGRAF